MTEDHPGPAASEEGGVFDHIVLGGGLAGLSLGLNLARSRPRARVLLLEAAPTLGGLARTTDLDGVLFDFGPHVLRDRDGHLLQRLSPHVRLRAFHTLPATYKHGTLFDHVIPVVSLANIERLPTAVRARAREEIGRLNSEDHRSHDDSFGSYLESRLGPTLTWEFFGQYSQKWWGSPPHELNVALAPKRIRVGETVTYSTVATGFTTPKDEYYPEEGGYGAIVSGLRAQAEEVPHANLTLRTGSPVAGLDLDGDRVRGVRTADGTFYEARTSVVSTIPLTRLGPLLGVPVPLRFRAEIGVFVTAEREAAKEVPASWIYYPEPEVIFARLSSPGRFSPSNETPERRGFCAEITCQEGDELWKMKDERIIERVLEDLRTLGLLGPGCDAHASVRREATAYPILDLHAPQVRDEVLQHLKRRAENLLPLGRTGAFQYWNADAVLALADLTL